MFKLTLTLSTLGECRFLIDGQQPEFMERDVLKMALEKLFFELG